MADDSPSKNGHSALLDALRHPLRRDILRVMRRSEQRISPRQIADTLGEPLSDVGYHCRTLKNSGAIELVGQQQVRGAIQNFYCVTVSEPWALKLLDEDEGAGGK